MVKKIWFSGLLGVKKVENSPKWQKIVSHSISQEPCMIMHDMIVIYSAYV